MLQKDIVGKIKNICGGGFSGLWGKKRVLFYTVKLYRDWGGVKFGQISSVEGVF